MKLLIIDASPHIDGSTSNLCSIIIDKLDKIDYELIKLSERQIEFCCGCQICTKTGECFQKDDTIQVINSIFSSDVVLIISPSYWGDVPAQFKKFIDRCLPFCNTNKHRHIILDKEKKPIGYAMSLRAGRNIRESKQVIGTIEHFLGHLGISLVDFCTFESIRHKEDLSLKLYDEKITDFIKKIQSSL